MKRRIKTGAFVLLWLLAFASVVFAQDGEVPLPPVNWGPIVAAGIGVLVMVVVELLKRVLPGLNPGAKQIIALVAGPALTWLATYVGGAIGTPVSFDSLIALLTAGGVASVAGMGSFDLLKSLGLLGKGGAVGEKA